MQYTSFNLLMMKRDGTKLETFFKKYKVIDYKKNETILRPDDNSSSIYYIKKGFVRIHTYSSEGKELTAIILSPGDVFPIALAISDVSNIYWYVTITPAHVYKAPSEDFRNFIKSDISVFSNITNQAVIHQSALIYRMQHIILGKANTTVASVILVYSKLLGAKKGDYIILKLPITHQHISFSAGITRETTSQ